MTGAPALLREPTPCWYCPHYGGMRADGTAAWCVERRQLQTAPEWGCARWSRAPGVDDEPWTPDDWHPLKPELVQSQAFARPR